MNKDDFLTLIGARGEDAEYVPVACLLRSGYGCAGYYNSRLNESLEDTCTLVNARLVGFHESRSASRGSIEDFSDFLEEVVLRTTQPDAPVGTEKEPFGRNVPLAAVPYDEMAVVYPIAHIGKMMQALQAEKRDVPAFFDFDNKSIILKLLRTKLW